MLTAAALVVGMAVATATLSVALEVGDRWPANSAAWARICGHAAIGHTAARNWRRGLPSGRRRRLLERSRPRQNSKRFSGGTIFSGFTPFLDVSSRDSRGTSLPDRMPGHSFTTLIGTWYEHAFRFPTAPTFVTGLSRRIRVGKSTARGLTTVRTSCRRRQPKSSSKLSRVDSAGSRDHAGCKTIRRRTGLNGNRKVAYASPASSRQATPKIAPFSYRSPSRKQFPGISASFAQLFVSALTKPADALSERDPKISDAHRIRSLVLLAVHFLDQLPDRTGVARHRHSRHPPRRGYRRQNSLAYQHAALDRHPCGADRGRARRGSHIRHHCASAARRNRHHESDRRQEQAGGTASFSPNNCLLALAGGAVGFVLGADSRAHSWRKRIWHACSPRLILFPVVLGLAAIVALVGSLIPLRRAARFEPAPILRGE